MDSPRNQQPSLDVDVNLEAILTELETTKAQLRTTQAQHETTKAELEATKTNLEDLAALEIRRRNAAKEDGSFQASVAVTPEQLRDEVRKTRKANLELNEMLKLLDVWYKLDREHFQHQIEDLSQEISNLLMEKEAKDKDFKAMTSRYETSSRTVSQRHQADMMREKENSQGVMNLYEKYNMQNYALERLHKEKDGLCKEKDKLEAELKAIERHPYGLEDDVENICGTLKHAKMFMEKITINFERVRRQASSQTSSQKIVEYIRKDQLNYQSHDEVREQYHHLTKLFEHFTALCTRLKEDTRVEPLETWEEILKKI